MAYLLYTVSASEQVFNGCMVLYKCILIITLTMLMQITNLHRSIYEWVIMSGTEMPS